MPLTPDETTPDDQTPDPAEAPARRSVYDLEPEPVAANLALISVYALTTEHLEDDDLLGLVDQAEAETSARNLARYARARDVRNPETLYRHAVAGGYVHKVAWADLPAGQQLSWTLFLVLVHTLADHLAAFGAARDAEAARAAPAAPIPIEDSIFAPVDGIGDMRPEAVAGLALIGQQDEATSDAKTGNDETGDEDPAGDQDGKPAMGIEAVPEPEPVGFLGDVTPEGADGADDDAAADDADYDGDDNGNPADAPPDGDFEDEAEGDGPDEEPDDEPAGDQDEEPAPGSKPVKGRKRRNRR